MSLLAAIKNIPISINIKGRGLPIETPTMIAPTALIILAAALVKAEDNPYTQYPSVAKTATINGFADPIYNQVPSCAQDCLKENKDTGNTPCPYWDTGCLCIMPQFANKVADCIAKGCSGGDVKQATDAAYGACQKAGVWEPYWQIGDEQKAALSKAAEVEAATTAEEQQPTSTAQQEVEETQAAPTTDAQEQQPTAAPEATQAAPTEAEAQTPEAENSAAPEEAASAAPEDASAASKEPTNEDTGAETTSAGAAVLPVVATVNGAATLGAGSLGLVAAIALIM